MANTNIGPLVKRIRRRLRLSQEGLARRVNATKGAVQHWERGRNKPDLSRLLGLWQICPSGPEWKQLDRMIGAVQAEVAPVSLKALARRLGAAKGVPIPPRYSSEGLVALRDEQRRLRRQVARMERGLARAENYARGLATIVRQLQRQLLTLQARFETSPRR